MYRLILTTTEQQLDRTRRGHHICEGLTDLNGGIVCHLIIVITDAD